jgi:hypothetical protein
MHQLRDTSSSDPAQQLVHFGGVPGQALLGEIARDSSSTGELPYFADEAVVAADGGKVRAGRFGWSEDQAEQDCLVLELDAISQPFAGGSSYV